MPLLTLLMLLLLASACATAPPPPSLPRPSVLPLRPKPPLAPRKRPAKRPAKEVKVPYEASGVYAIVPGGAPPRPGRGEVVRYLVEEELGLPFDPAEFAAQVHRTLNDVRGWARFERVDHGPVQVRVALSSPGLTIRQCSPLDTGGELSCWNGERSVINARRWAKGVPQYGGDLTAYRNYLISHEVGHSLGHEHRACPGPGRLAPVMTQQSKSLDRCRPNPWPFPNRRPGENEETEDRGP
ncbi:DUF3152 domain-containing protein [Nonomuraea sp. NPDC049784]|uniref:DUF3152 domain-containing protein n=1 Tax=Nonomuraea sp. NPDC049784 TaxID=3154361 RepID=UPI0033CBB7D3